MVKPNETVTKRFIKSKKSKKSIDKEKYRLNYDHIRLKLEKEMGQELYKLINGDIIDGILREAKIESTENEWKFLLEGHSFKITEEMAPKLFAIVEDVLQKLEYSDGIEFYVRNSPELNAAAICNLEENQNHLIFINSGLIEILDDDELKFVIGHEIGHLISNNSKIHMLIRHIYPNAEKVPIILQNKIALWNKLSEMTADRFGYLACGDLEKCLSCFFVLASGLTARRISFNANAYLKENNRILEFFRRTTAANRMAHPVNPIRIKAVEEFSSSKTVSNINNEQKLSIDNTLSSSIDELVDMLLMLSSSELNMHRMNFIAAAGIMMAGVDTEMGRSEYNEIITWLSGFTTFPKKFFQEIMEQRNVQELFVISLQETIKINPADRYLLFKFLVSVMVSDHKMVKQEVDFLYEVGTKLFGFTRKELAQNIAQEIQSTFIPDFYKTP
ncbi:MAG: M48 family metallopeptidase [Candidatus Cloacimonetes bacterium]|nr:M48 family metallopeptidase [Candidatus Cloacimonadota bacterium]